MKKPSSQVLYQTLLRWILIFIVYLAVFVVLDARSYELEVFPGIVAWYPPDGLSFAFLLSLGTAFLPAFAAASLISSFLIFKFTLPFPELIGWTVLISLTYGFASWFLRRIRVNTQLRSMRDLFSMTTAGSIAATLLAWVAVHAIVASGAIPQAEQFWASVQWWIGETIGILVLTPFLLIHIMPHVKRFAEGENFLPKGLISLKRPSITVIMQALSMVAAIYLAVDVKWPNEFHPFFLVAIPLIWIAMEHGIAGASIANVLINFGLTMAVQRHDHFNPFELGQLQLMMLVVILASLLVGMIVSENKQFASSASAEIGRSRKKTIYELIIISVLAMTAWVMEFTFDIYEAISAWERHYQVKGVHEMMAALLVLGMASAVFSYRRWQEVQEEIREREKAQAELQTLYGELEARVQERTADLTEANVSLQLEIIQRAQAETRIQRQMNYLTALQDIDRSIASTLEMRSSLNTLLARAVSLLAVDAVSVMLINSAMGTGEYVAHLGFQSDMEENIQIPLRECYAGKVVIKRSLIKIPYLAEEQDNLLLKTFLKDEMFVSYYGLPLTIKRKVIGVLEVYQRSLVKRDQEWLDFLNALAGQAAIAIDNAQLFENLQRSNADLTRAYDATIEGWSLALDLRDKETEGHTQRVTQMTVKLAERMGMSEQDLMHIRRGSLLHDIGKMGIPDQILLKPGILTEEEWEVMRMHPLYAHQMLEPISYLGPALEIPYCHHEKWDGTGYPRQLKGTDIPLSARIFAIVDVYDALTSNRPYRNGWSHEKTAEYIRAQSGSHFDPQVVEAFLDMVEKDKHQ